MFVFVSNLQGSHKTRMNTHRKFFCYITLLCLFLAAVVSLGGCTNAEKAKAGHVSKGEAYLKDSKFQEAALEFRNALQLDDKLAAAHWGLARAYEGLLRLPEMLQELKKTIELDQNNLVAKNKLGNLYLGVREVLNLLRRPSDLQKTFCKGTRRILKATFYSAVSGLRRTRRTKL